MLRLRTVTSLDVSAVAGHHAMPAALLFSHGVFSFFRVTSFSREKTKWHKPATIDMRKKQWTCISFSAIPQQAHDVVMTVN